MKQLKKPKTKPLAISRSTRLLRTEKVHKSAKTYNRHKGKVSLKKEVFS